MPHDQLCREVDDYRRLERAADDRHDFTENRRCLDELGLRQEREHETPAHSDTGAIWKLRNAADIVDVARRDTDQSAAKMARTMRRVAFAVLRGRLTYRDLASLRALVPGATSLDGESLTSIAPALKRAITWLARPRVVRT